MLGLLIALIVINGLMFLMVGFLVIVGVLLLDRTKYIIPMISQLDNIEASVVGGSMDESEFPLFGPGVFRSLDGKHIASSLEELQEKMQNDPDSTDESKSDLDKLFNGEVDDEDDDEPDEKWKRK